METDVTFGPVYVAAPGMNRVMEQPHHPPDFFKRFRFLLLTVNGTSTKFAKELLTRSKRNIKASGQGNMSIKG